MDLYILKKKKKLPILYQAPHIVIFEARNSSRADIYIFDNHQREKLNVSIVLGYCLKYEQGTSEPGEMRSEACCSMVGEPQGRSSSGYHGALIHLRCETFCFMYCGNEVVCCQGCGAEQRNSTPVACEAGRACDKEEVRGRGEINSYIIFVEGG